MTKHKHRRKSKVAQHEKDIFQILDALMAICTKIEKLDKEFSNFKTEAYEFENRVSVNKQTPPNLDIR